MQRPKISIVTACYNASKYIEATIKSVIDQPYSPYEYIIIDGGSSDNTEGIIERYRGRLAYCRSGPDQGQYWAIKEGFEHASGEIMAWLNADDMYFPYTLQLVGHLFSKYKDIIWITGLPSFWDASGILTNVYHYPASYPQSFIRKGFYRSHLCGYLQQESMFWRRELWEKVKGFNLNLKLAADFELWTRFAIHADLVSVRAPLAGFRILSGEQKSSVHREAYEEEVKEVCRHLEPPLHVWDVLSRRGLVLRNLCRLLIWKESRVVAYNSGQKEWVVGSSRRPVSRISLSDMLLEFKVARLSSPARTADTA